MSLLRRFAVLASSAALALAGAGVVAEPAFANSTRLFCVYIDPGDPQYDCAKAGTAGHPVGMALGYGVDYTVSNASGLPTHIALPADGNLCLQAFASIHFNGGWAVHLEKCNKLSGQYWYAIKGPVIQSPTVEKTQTYYWANVWNAAYCLSWDRDAGELFVITCRNAYYQQFFASQVLGTIQKSRGGSRSSGLTPGGWPRPLGLEGIEAIVFRTVGDQVSLWESLEPA